MKILQSDWLRAFRPISQEQEFSQIWDLCTNTANNTNFHYRANLVKIKDHFFQQTIFGPFLAHLPMSFHKNSSSVTYDFTKFSGIMPNSEKTGTGRGWTKEQKDEQIVFYDTLLKKSKGLLQLLIIL